MWYPMWPVDVKGCLCFTSISFCFYFFVPVIQSSLVTGLVKEVSFKENKLKFMYEFKYNSSKDPFLVLKHLWFIFFLAHRIDFKISLSVFVSYEFVDNKRYLNDLMEKYTHLVTFV